MAETYVTNKKLAEELGISLDELTRIEDYFDEIPDDEWELVQGRDYRVINGKGTREYTQDGAYTIARYLEATKTLGFFEKIREWFTGYRKKVRQSFVRQKITDNCSSLVKRGDRFWISRSDARAIFGTRSDYLTKMAEQAQKTEYPLIRGADYEDFLNDGGLHFSLSGIEKLSRVFATNLTRRNRQEECKDVGEVIHTQVKSLVEKIIEREKRITKVCKYVKEDRDKNRCLVTGEKKHRNSNFDWQLIIFTQGMIIRTLQIVRII